MTGRSATGVATLATLAALSACGGSHHPCRSFPTAAATGLLDGGFADSAAMIDTGHSDSQGNPVSVVAIQSGSLVVVLGHARPPGTAGVQGGFWVAMDATSAQATGFPEDGQPSIVQDIADAARSSVGAAKACL